MTHDQPFSIFGHFLRRQIIVCVIVVFVAAIAIQQLFRAYIHQALELRAIELTQMIDGIAAISRSPQHLRYAIRELGRSNRAKEILILSAKDGSVLASTTPEHYTKGPDSGSFPARLAHEALQSGRFTLDAASPSGERYSALPLTLAAFLLSGDNVLATGHWTVPKWYRKLHAHAEGGRGSLLLLFELAMWNDYHDFTLRPGQYSGVVVINSSGSWMTSLLAGSSAFVATIILMVVIALIASTSLFFRSAVHRPIRAFSGVIERLRRGDHAVRSPRHGIREFDALADQWNSLLDERAAAEEQHRILARLMENAPLGIELMDAEGRVIYANPATERMTGFDLGNLVGMRLHGLLANGRDPDRTLAALPALLAKGRIWRGVVDYRRRDGSALICDLTLCPILGKNGELHRLIAVRHDITALKQHERDLVEARIKAEAANRAKSAFIANTNHEIRTPLNAIVGFSEMLASERLGPLGNPDYREFARLLEDSARSLLSIVNTIMDLSRLQSGCAPLNIETFDPVEPVARILRQWEARAAERGIAIELRSTTRGHRLKADEQQVCKIVDNLVSNAVKFGTDGGKVRVSLRLDRQRRLALTVEDDGIGIVREHLAEVTEPFFQVDKSLARATGGIGLGLTVVRECAILLGATLDIRSRPGKGTRIDVVFPAACTVGKPAAARPARRTARDTRSLAA